MQKLQKLYNKITIKIEKHTLYKIIMSEKKDAWSEKKINPILNDIYNDEEIKNVDISSIFLLSKTQVFHSLFKHDSNDIRTNLKKSVFLSLYPKLKLLKLQRPFNNDIKKVKKNTPVILSHYLPEKKLTTLDLSDLKDLEREIPQSFDLLHPKKPKFKFSLWFQLSILKIWISFVILCFVLFWYGFATKFYIERTFASVQNLDIKNFANLQNNLKDIRSHLVTSNALVKPLLWLNYFIGNSSVNNLGKILPGGLDMTNFALHFFEIYDGVNAMIQEKWIEEIMFSQLIDNIEPILFSMQKDLQNGVKLFESVWEFSDENLNAQFKKYITQFSALSWYFDILMSNLSTLKDILGHEEKRTYFIIFQNNDEIRPTGWFMWSVWILEVFRGKIANFETKDIYAIEWDLKDFATKNGTAFEQPAPAGLNKISQTFWLRDANYYPSIEESSLKIQDFLKNSEYKVDGIIYINQNLISNVLEKIGPIYYDFVQRDITSENFSTLFSTLVEAKITKTHTLATPKQVLFDFIDIFLEKIKSVEDYNVFIELFIESIEKKDVSFYLFKPEENTFLQEIWLEKTYDFKNYLDFNYPVFTSISGNKSDRYITRSFEKKYAIQENCDIKTSFKIKQKHGFNINEEVYIKTLLYDMNALGQVDVNNILNIQWKWVNKQYIRVLIPKNAQVTQNKNISIKDYPEYKEISFYLDTNTLFESNFTLEYMIPNSECKNYDYFLPKQPGIKSYGIDMIKNWNLEQSLYTETDFTFND